MKSPKGFAKNYFTFSSVLAHTVEKTLQNKVTSIHSFLYNKTSIEDDSELEENDPPNDILQSICIVKPCHCNCYYKLKTKLTLLWNIFIPRCVYYTPCFAFRRSGTHPPL